MYYSRNQKVRYISHDGSGLMDVVGTGLLSGEDIELWVEPHDGDWKSACDILNISESVTGIETGFLEAFPHIRCLILGRAVESVAVTSALKQRLRQNDVLIRGEYDTFAESFAREMGLKFLHSDIRLADDENEKYHQYEIITLRFHPGGFPDIHHDCYTSGNSGGCFDGGEFTTRPPPDLEDGCSMERFVEHFPERLRVKLLSNDRLRRFLDASARRHSVKESPDFACFHS